MIDQLEKPRILVCNEVRGGNRKFIGTRKLLGIEAWVASIPINLGDGGGDLHFMSVCSHDLISRIALADVSGHGREVDAAAVTLHELMRKNIDVWGQSDFMRGLNDTFNQDGGGHYATAIVLSFHRVTGHLAFSNAGHLPPLWYHASEQIWGWLREGDPVPHEAFGLPVGLIPGTGYCQTVVTLRPSDILVLYSDGITDAENSAGKDLGREQLLEWAREGLVERQRRVFHVVFLSCGCGWPSACFRNQLQGTTSQRLSCVCEWTSGPRLRLLHDENL